MNIQTEADELYSSLNIERYYNIYFQVGMYIYNARLYLEVYSSLRKFFLSFKRHYLVIDKKDY